MLLPQTEPYLRCSVFKAIIALAQTQLTERQQKIFTVFVFLSLLILWACYGYYFNPPIFPLDDGYIYLHNAQALHLGYDRNYVNVSPLDGSTSPIYLLLVTILLFVLSPLWVLQTAIWLGVLVYALGLLRLAFVYTASVIHAFLFLIGGLTIVYMPLQLFNGVETGWAMAAVTWLLVLSSEVKTVKHRIPIHVLCGLLPFLRPELFILSSWIIAWQIRLYYQSATSSKDWLFNIAGNLFIVLLAAAPWVIWYWCSIGQPYPMTINAKDIFVAQACQPWHLRNNYFLNCLLNFSQLADFLVLLSALILLSMTVLGRIVLLSVLSFLVLFWLYMPLAIGFNDMRYLYILIPMLLYGIISCIHHRRTEIRWFANFLLMLMAVYGVVIFPQKWRQYLIDAHVMTNAVTAVANWCNAHLPANSVILLHDAGYMAVATPFHLIDLVGLKTPENIYYQRKYIYEGCHLDRGAATAAIIHRYHPDYLIILPDWEQVFGIIHNREQLGWSVKLLYKTSPKGYKVYKINTLN